MKIYLVGGAVRDALLKRTVTERDWVVVGSTPEEMQALGYKPVGKDFPVFLHPKTQEEYALARTERKVGKGYKGFTVYADPSVTLEQDLIRRDLTINAIAEDDHGQLTDPFHGQQDLADKCLRHVSAAFVEDPVRILRVARFAARLPEFTVHEQTVALMKTMVANGEVDALVAERVWKELERALGETNPLRFFEVLQSCGAFEVLFAELSDQHLQSLRAMSDLQPSAYYRFAGWLYLLPVDEIKSLCRRLRVPKNYLSLTLLLANYFEPFKQALSLSAEELLTLLQGLDVLRKTERFYDFLAVCESLADEDVTTIKEKLLWAFEKIQEVDTQAIVAKGLNGEDFARALWDERIKLLNS